jgi:hypothetical protein
MTFTNQNRVYGQYMFVDNHIAYGEDTWLWLATLFATRLYLPVGKNVKLAPLHTYLGVRGGIGTALTH